MSKEPFISRMGFSSPSQAEEVKLDRDLAAIKEGLAQLAAGQRIPAEDVEAWIESLGTKDERPPPRVRR